MLGHRLRRWPSINPALAKSIVFGAWMSHYLTNPDQSTDNPQLIGFAAQLQSKHWAPDGWVRLHLQFLRSSPSQTQTHGYQLIRRRPNLLHN